jgi:hypothetical protein
LAHLKFATLWRILDSPHFGASYEHDFLLPIWRILSEFVFGAKKNSLERDWELVSKTLLRLFGHLMQNSISREEKKWEKDVFFIWKLTAKHARCEMDQIETILIKVFAPRWKEILK